MSESSVVVIGEDILAPAIRDYKPTSSSSSGQSLNCKIRKVQPDDRPQENTMSAYTPKIISIGPLHHGKPELKPMEDLKHKYLIELLNRRGEYGTYVLLGRLIEEGRKMEEKVRDYYELSKINTIRTDDFVRMLVIDGCFLIEFLIRWNSKRKSDDLGLGRHRPLINHDIQLFENQIPFFVLQKFYEILGEYETLGEFDYYGRSIVEVAHYYMTENHVTFGFAFSEASLEAFSEPKNLLHLRYLTPVSLRGILDLNLCCCILSSIFCKFSCWICSFVCYWMMSVPSSLLYFIYKIFFADITYPTKLISATEIEEAGVRLQGSRMDLRFKKGTLTIPVLTLNQETLRQLKNLMVFEFYFRSGGVPPYVHQYVSFLSLLIKNPRDLKVLEEHHIIRTSGGGDESFALVNELIQAGFEELMSGEKPMTGHPDFDWQSRFSI